MRDQPAPEDFSSTEALVKKRGEVYGDPRENFGRIADFWTTALRDKLNCAISPMDVAQCMRLVKESRLCNSPDHVDSLKDISGYVLCQLEIVGAK